MRKIFKQLGCVPKPWLGRAAGGRRGVGMIETAVVLPVLLYMVLGAVEFGQFFFIRHSFVAAARDAARAACLANAVKADPASRATRTLAQANVTYQASWMTIVDITKSNSTVTDCSAVSMGDKLQVTISCPYDQIPNAFRPLYRMTGRGIGAGKMCSGQCELIKE
jgi:Flp pilus assembly protein TadG